MAVWVHNSGASIVVDEKRAAVRPADDFADPTAFMVETPYPDSAEAGIAALNTNLNPRFKAGGQDEWERPGKS